MREFRPALRPAGILSRVFAVCIALAAGCATPPATAPVAARPDVAPTSQPTTTAELALDRAQIKPMYHELLPVDLAAVVQVAAADNLAIRHAREEVTAAKGAEESAVGAAFPAIVPTALFDHVDGTVRATEGNLVNVGFSTFQPSVAVQWVLNPGSVIYEILASKKRLAATQHEERAVVQRTLATAAVQYYELVLAQTLIATAHQALSEAEELLRINRLRVRSGTGVLADELRAEAQRAERQQDLTLALNAFYQASVALTFTLHLEDPTVTLVPSIDHLAPIRLVRDDLPVEELLELAVDHRPDLEGVRTLLAAAMDDRGATWWGAFGPQVQVRYQYGGITGHANNTNKGQGLPGNLIVNPASSTGAFNSSPVANGLIREVIGRGSQRGARNRDATFGFTDQQRVSAAIGWRLSLAAFGDLKRAGAIERQVAIDADRVLDQVRAEVIGAAQDGRTNHDLIALAQQQVAAADEALRLSQANLQAGTMTTLDVLQAQDAVARARLRHADAVVRFNQSQVFLLAALGLLDADSVSASKESG